MLFSLPTDSGYEIPRQINPLECWIQNLKLESIPMFIRDIVAWEIFPNIVSCDWSDIFSAVGGRTCRLVVCETDDLKLVDDYQRLLLQHESLFREAEGVFMLVSIDHKVSDPLEMFLAVTEPLDTLLKDDCEIAWTDCVYTSLPVKIRVAFLIAQE